MDWDRLDQKREKKGFWNSPLICLDHLEIIRRTAQLQHRRHLHGSLIQPSTTMLEGKDKALMENCLHQIRLTCSPFKNTDIWTFKVKIAHNNLHDSAWDCTYLTILIYDFVIRL